MLRVARLRMREREVYKYERMETRVRRHREEKIEMVRLQKQRKGEKDQHEGVERRWWSLEPRLFG